MHQLVEKCAGIFSTGNFPLWAEQFMSFDGEAVIGQHAWPRAVGKARYSRGVSFPADIASALYGLVELSGRELTENGLRHLTLVGVADAGLIAAIAIWLFDLKVAIYAGEEKEENLRFRNGDEDVEPHLTIIYTRQVSARQNSANQNILSQDSAHQNPAYQGMIRWDPDHRDPGNAADTVRELRRTIHLPDATVLFRSHAQSKPNQDRAVGGRVHWKGALEGTFGDSFKSLLRMTTPFGTAIGSAGRIFTAIVEADADVPEGWLRNCSIYFPESHGQNFANFTQRRFQELSSKNLGVEMLKAVRVSSYGEAKATFETSMENLASSCGCKVCSPTNYTKSSNNPGAQQSAHHYCFMALTSAIIRITHGLSGIDPVDDLHPSRLGLEYIYEMQQTIISRLRRQDGKNVLPITHCIIEHATPDMGWTEISLLRFAQYIFSGQTFHDIPDDPGSSAIATDGLCYYLDILRNPIQDDPITLARVNVIPGYIHYKNILFHRVSEKSTNLFSACVRAPSSSKGRPRDCVPEKVVQGVEKSFGGGLELLLTGVFD
ncbi:MAG: hypothetical protein M1813_005461 [Trichoglossum hirsutum]|nr:MAG: hypothetical protein M1813_005461 [Trichoglossum hirsutum]